METRINFYGHLKSKSHKKPSKCVFEHLKDPNRAFRGFSRVLKPGGHVVFLTPNKYDYVSVIASVVPNFLHQKIVKFAERREEAETFPTFYRANSKAALKRFGNRLGFSIEHLEYHTSYPSMFKYHPVLYRLGIAYDKFVSRHARLHWLQAWLLGSMRKCKRIGH